MPRTGFSFSAKPLAAVALFALAACALRAQESFRPPAVPLITSDPYLSIWSENDNLTDGPTRHWTHAPNSLVGIIAIDGQNFRFMGDDPDSVSAIPQKSLTVTPTRTTYVFATDKVELTETFLAPLLPGDLAIYSRPVTYVTFMVRSLDSAKHNVDLYFSASSQITVNDTQENVSWRRSTAGDLTLLRVGATDQTLLRPMGDDTRINWGYLYVAAPTKIAASAIGDNQSLIASFLTTRHLPKKDDPRASAAVKTDQPVLAYAFHLPKVGAAMESRRLMVGYDELDSILYFGEKLKPYWRKNFADPAALFTQAAADYPTLVQKCGAFDFDLTNDAMKAGDANYAEILALAYRECAAANGLAVDDNGQPLLFTKENTSNGDIATVDVIFPMDPIWVLLSPTLAKASLESNFAYAASPHWKFDNAPHDLGTYPQAFGRDDGGEGMPVEESGNMIILTDAIAHAEGNPEYAKRWWPQLTQWAHYLEKYGLDPEDQLCTDDFMGHLAHNANLSVKAILALAAYGDLCARTGDTANAAKYKGLAADDAKHWMQVADAGGHSLLAFDKPGTWSQKYNLVWDHILGLNVFPASAPADEVKFYKTQLQPYGLPLDSRTKLTKTDWSIWSATMATRRQDFNQIVDLIAKNLGTTTTRDPIADSYMTNDPSSGGMHARPVVGGLFIKLLDDPLVWQKWASRDTMKVGDWAPLPKPPTVEEVVPTARTAKVTWTYTLAKPAGAWTSATFDDSGWKSGVGAFASDGTPGAIVGTQWTSDDIWLRRVFDAPSDAAGLQLEIYHDEDVEVYFNGVLALSEPGFDNSYSLYDVSPAALAVLKRGGKITMAVHCHQTTGGQGVDVGLVRVVAAGK